MEDKETLIAIREDYLSNGSINVEHYNCLVENHLELTMIDVNDFIEELDKIIENL